MLLLCLIRYRLWCAVHRMSVLQDFLMFWNPLFADPALGGDGFFEMLAQRLLRIPAKGASN